MTIVRSMLGRVALLCALVALLVAGCGGTNTSGSGSSAAEVAGLVPASAPLLIALETDPESEQWKQADDLVSRFPGKQRLLDEVRKGLAQEGMDLQQDILPALGDETYIAVLDFDEGDVVGITKPRDKDKLAELLRESDESTVTREVDGWTLIAETEEVLDSFEAESEKLEGADWFDAAQGRVEEDALVTLFANGPAIQDALAKASPDGCDLSEAYGKLDYAAGTLAAEKDGFRMRVAAAGDGIEDLIKGESLLSQIPTGAFAYLGSPGFDSSQFSLGDQLRCGLDAEELPDVEQQIGASFDEIFDLFAGGYGVYVRSATLIPEVTLLLAPEDEARAVETLDGLAKTLAGLADTEVEFKRVGETDARELNFGPVSVLYGAGDGKVVLSTAAAGFDALTGQGDKLKDDDAFRDAREAAGVGDGDDIYAYFDLSQLTELVERLARFADQDVPPEVGANLEPLGSFLAWGDLSDPDNIEFGAFLAIR